MGTLGTIKKTQKTLEIALNKVRNEIPYFVALGCTKLGKFRSCAQCAQSSFLWNVPLLFVAFDIGTPEPHLAIFLDVRKFP